MELRRAVVRACRPMRRRRRVRGRGGKNENANRPRVGALCTAEGSPTGADGDYEVEAGRGKRKLPTRSRLGASSFASSWIL